MEAIVDDIIDYGEGKIAKVDLIKRLEAGAKNYNCGTYLYHLNSINRCQLYQDLETERLSDKYKRQQTLFEHLGRDWNMLFIAQLLKYLGNTSNRATFVEMISRLQSNAIQRARTNLHDIEVLLLAASGLEKSLVKNSFTKEICKSVEYVRHKFQIEPLKLNEWSRQNIKPQTEPILRIMQVAGLLHKNDLIFNKLISCRTRDDIFNLFDAGASTEWVRYFGGYGKSISKEKCDLLGINFVVPMLYAFGRHTSNEALIEAANDLNEALPIEDNSIIRRWREKGLNPIVAYEGQALIQLREAYCKAKRCKECHICRHMCGKESILREIPKFLL